MSRADKERFDFDDDADERPNVPPVPFDDDDTAWGSRCYGNKTQRHLSPTAKMNGLWRCGSCGHWLTPPKGRT